MLSSDNFRPYYSNDIIGAQIGGAVKNVIAIACGIVAGKKLGSNAIAAVISRSIVEISRLCVKMGGNPETLIGLSGFGDIALTCNNYSSRNMSFGMEIAKGKKISSILKDQMSVVEGVASADAVYQLSLKYEIKMPITTAVYNILYNDADIGEVFQSLLSRPQISESID